MHKTSLCQKFPQETHNLASARATSCMQKRVDNYFDVVTKQYQLSLITFGSNIWNYGFFGDQGKAMVVCRKGARCVLKLTGNNEKTHYTVNSCCNTDDHFTPPFMFYTFACYCWFSIYWVISTQQK